MGLGGKATEDAAPVAVVGARLRAARRRRGLTLDQLATATGLTKSFLSRLERDQVSPSVATLVRVCGVLGLGVGELFEPPKTSLVRKAERRRINFGGQDVLESLLTPDTQKDLQVIHSVIDPGGTGGDELYSLGCKVEFVYVIAGNLRLSLVGDTHELAAGDAFTFPGQEPHTWANTSHDAACEVLWVLAPAP
ncbi:XRE family transcriptional regulator [Humibacillus sp. DSM 29435]|uniref:helix-turn-helix domain-containing protein n=1 Tax=Humibacillus sp. DSM 29435 TaxID=1869167 RepID=UPI000872B576|nr:XRE family transcriptional regulator [Humibacillus sp. DSM 29435]OFE15934.1 XRE family transcriptional regulator [Humibacillus sp. DSM 29435]